ncbi:hypothetical protein TNCV_5059911 [Trichonephila clavipes]|nr:hypothetical protein TNCV_5059911 [Trichonephila clavipes]
MIEKEGYLTTAGEGKLSYHTFFCELEKRRLVSKRIKLDESQFPIHHIDGSVKKVVLSFNVEQLLSRCISGDGGILIWRAGPLSSSRRGRGSCRLSECNCGSPTSLYVVC